MKKEKPTEENMIKSAGTAPKTEVKKKKKRHNG